jgi:transposase
MLERGIACAKGRISLRNEMPAILEDSTRNLTPRLRNLLDQLWEEWKQLQADIERSSEEIDQISEEDAACKRLRQIPGVGPLVATAMVAAIGNGAAFVQLIQNRSDLFPLQNYANNPTPPDFLGNLSSSTGLDGIQ